MLAISAFIVRLINGSTDHEGRVEVYINGEWGTVCGWDLNDAQVVCNELGLGIAVVAVRSAFYGQGSGPIWNLNCIGNELSITNCSHRRWGFSHCSRSSSDASVRCSTGDI